MTDRMTLFEPLDRILERFADAGLPATFWWRDDDAARPSPALDRLLSLLSAHDLPLGLAVVPAHVDEALAARVAGMVSVAVLQHGYAHQNHAGAGEKKIELGAHRPAQIVIGELATGWLRLESLFGRQALPVLVPPWNRLSAALVPVLPELGYRGLSQFGPRRGARPLKTLLQVNCHVDLIDWRTRAFAGPDATIAALANHLELRYSGRKTQPQLTDEPTGIMTHHAVHDDSAWDFLARLAGWLAGSRHAQVLPANAVFAT